VRSDFSDFGVSGPPYPRLAGAERGACRIGERHVAPPEPENLATAKAGRDDGQEHDARLLAPSPLVLLRLVDELDDRPKSLRQ
jgi:hypothetical protein